MSLPLPLQALVDPVIASLRTGGKVAFPEGGESSIWFVLCETRCWLVAGSGGASFAVASTQVQMARGWTWDALQVGNWSTPLRTGSRSMAQKLVERWKNLPQGGERVDLPAMPEGTTPAAVSARIPGWIPGEVPADPEARWLFAYETAESVPFPGREGQPDLHPLWVLVSDRELWIAAPGGWSRPVSTVTSGSRGLRAKIVVDGRSLAGAVVDRRQDDLLALSASSDRWATALELLIDAKEHTRAGELCAEAFLLGRAQGLWTGVGAMAFANGSVTDALIAAHQIEDPTSALAIWEGAAAGAEVPRGLLAEAEQATLPDGLPTPTTAREVLAAGAISRGQAQVGLALWPAGPDQGSALAAVEGSSEAWHQAALRWRPEDPARAVEELDRSLAIEATPLTQYQAAAWALEDGRSWQEFVRAAFPAAPPADFHAPQAFWQRLAEVAEGECEAAALVSWQQVGDAASLWKAVEVLEPERPEEAIEVARRLVFDPGVRSAWQARATLARLYLRQDMAAEAEEVLQQLVAEDYLSIEAVQTALDTGEGLLGPDVTARWRHLCALFGPGLAAHTLTADGLAGLHPGGIDWFSRTRHSLGGTEPPDRTQIVRGLEPVRDDHPLAPVIATLSERLGMEPPPAYLFRGEGAWGFAAWPTDPPVLLIGNQHLREGELELDEAGLAYALAVELAHLAAKHPLLSVDGGIVGTSRSAYAALGTYAGAAEAVVDVLTLVPGIDQIAKIGTLMRLSKRVFTAKSAFDKASDVATNLFTREKAEAVARSFDGTALQFRLHADRAALAVTGHLGAALDTMLATPDTQKLRLVLREQGVLAVLGEADEDLTLRMVSLLAWFSTYRPDEVSGT